ncbi:guanylate kinase [Limisalsivibrio acetivorans]|uniref:guanylate kinase n=1 Tax=Limisalsivibrio acetivorans TaxID=1304888 RepID=UPI0003B4AFE8|nr:guanylate kinase [Limisalsivibrio acetivorans]
MKVWKGKLFVVSAPSGAGKTSLCNRLLEEEERISYSISYTTRQPRHDEEHGRDYFFINVEEFESMIEDGEFIEWAKVHNNYYGTRKKTVEEYLADGRDVLLDIDPQGARQLRKKLGYGVYIFITAPSIAELEKRLRNRRTEPEEIMKLRLDNARKELKLFGEYDYIILNQDFDEAYRCLSSVYLAEHLKTIDINSIHDLMEKEEQ